jgi:UDP-glucose 4-epimerase
LVQQLFERGAHITLLVSEAFTPARLRAVLSGVTIHPFTAVEELCGRERPDLVYHLASTPFQPASRPAAEHADAILGGTLKLLEALRRAPPRRFVFAGSAAEYGDGSQLRETSPCRPATVLGAMKLAAAALVTSYGRMLGMETVIARLFTPFGPWESPSRLVPYTIGSAKRGEPVRLRGDGKQQRDFVYVEDAAESLILMGAASLDRGSVFNVSSGAGTPARDMARRVLSLMGSNVSIECGATESRLDEIRECSGDSTLAREVLGWKPRRLDEGILETIRWFEENPHWLQQQAN